jgi:hypothetical protein
MNVSNQTLEIHHENDIFMNIFIIISILIHNTLFLLYFIWYIYIMSMQIIYKI